VKKLRVLLADDHKLMIDAVQVALESDGDFEVVGTTTDATKVVGLVSETSPDVVVLDVRMPLLDGIACLGRIRNRDPNVKVVMLSGLADPEIEREALLAGAVAYLDKRVDPTTLAACLRSVIDGAAAAAGTGCAPPDDAAFSALTEREREILVQVSRGKSNADIAAGLWLSEQTIKYHLTNVYRKLGVKGRPGAVRYVFEHGRANELERPTA